MIIPPFDILNDELKRNMHKLLLSHSVKSDFLMKYNENPCFLKVQFLLFQIFHLHLLLIGDKS